MLAAMFTLLHSPALADIGPPPRCPRGQYRVYLQGHRCVQEGYHLEIDAEGNVIEVKDAEPAGEDTDGASADVSDPVVQPQGRGCRRTAAAQSLGAVGLLGLLIGWRGRRGQAG